MLKPCFASLPFQKKKFAVWPAKICLEQVWKTATGLLFKDISVRSSVRSLPVGKAGVERHVRAAARSSGAGTLGRDDENLGLWGCLTTSSAC